MNSLKTIQRKGAKARRREGSQFASAGRLSSAPGFSPVFEKEMSQSRFNGLADLHQTRSGTETVETVRQNRRRHTRLKLGADEIITLRLSAFAPLR